MAIDVGENFRNGLQSFFSVRGLVVGLLLLVMAVANLVVQQSISLHVQEWLFGLLSDDAAQQTAMSQAGSTPPFALDVAIPVLLALTLVFLLINELIRLVGIRLFGSESDEVIPVADLTENLGSAAVKMLVLGGVLSFVVMVINLIPIIGAIIGWVLALLFVYLRQAIALEDEGWFDTVGRSVELFLEDPLPIAAVLLILGIFGAVVSMGVPFALTFAVFDGGSVSGAGSILENTQALSTLVGVVLGVLFQVLGIALVTDAYKQVRASVDEEAV